MRLWCVCVCNREQSSSRVRAARCIQFIDQVHRRTIYVAVQFPFKPETKIYPARIWHPDLSLSLSRCVHMVLYYRLCISTVTNVLLHNQSWRTVEAHPLTVHYDMIDMQGGHINIKLYVVSLIYCVQPQASRTKPKPICIGCVHNMSVWQDRRY